MKHDTLKIPFCLARHLLREKRHPQLRVWLAMKSVHGSWCRKDELDKQKIASLCGFSTTKTVDYHLDKLLEWNWVGRCERNYYFRGIGFLLNIHGYKRGNYKGYHVDIKRELTALQEVLFTVAIKHLIRWRRFKGVDLGTLKQVNRQLQQYQLTSLAVRLLSKMIGISTNMVHRLKQSCKHLGYLLINNYSRLVLPWEYSYLYHHKQGYLFTKDNAIRVRLTDTVVPYF